MKKTNRRLFGVLLISIAVPLALLSVRPILGEILVGVWILPDLENLIYEKADHAAAKVAIAHWLEIFPENGDLVDAALGLYLQDRDAALMKKATANYLKRRPNDNSARFVLADVLLEEGSYEGAIQQCDFVLSRPDRFSEDDLLVFQTLKTSIEDKRRKALEAPGALLERENE